MRTSARKDVRKRTVESSKSEQSKAKKKKKDLMASSNMSSARKKKNKPNSRAKNAHKSAKYKEAHAVGRRSSSQFVTYSQDGRLFYDLYTRYTPYTSREKTVDSTRSHSKSTSAVTNNPSKRRLPISATEPNHKPRVAVVRSQLKRHTVTRKKKDSLPTKVSVTRLTTQNRSIESKRTKPVLQKRSTKTQISKKETAKVKLERKLKRELGADFLPHIQAVGGKRLASINAVAIINAVTKDTAKRVSPGSKGTSVRRRYSVDTVPCVEEKGEQVHDIASVHSEDALTEPMSLSPQREAVLKGPTTSPMVITPSVPISFPPDEATASEVSRKRKRGPSTALRRKSTPLTKTPPVSATPSQELVTVKPQTSGVESYHSEQVIPLGPSSFGFHQITTQVIRYAQPDYAMLINSGAVPLLTGPTGAPCLTPSPATIRTPGDFGPNLNSSEIFNANRAHTFLANLSLPVLTPMPAMGNWPTIIHPPYNHHITQSIPQHISHPNPTILFPSFIPLQTQVQYPILPHMLNPQLEHSPAFMSPTSLFPSPMCNLPPLQSPMTPSIGLLRPVQPSVSYPSLYYPPTAPTYAIRDGSVPLSVPHPPMTACTSSSLGIQLPMYSQPIFSFPTPNTIPVSIPVNPHNSQSNAFTINPLTVSPSGAFVGASNPAPQPDIPKLPFTPIILTAGSGTVPELCGPFNSIESPVRTMVHSNESNGTVTNNVIPHDIPVSTVQSMSTASPSSITAVVTTSASSKAQSHEAVEPCSTDGLNNAWQWEGSSFTKAVFCRSDAPPVVIRTCYRAIRHRRDGMVIREKDCVLLCSGPDRSTAPHVAKITALFADPNTADTKMMALLWYYRPEHVGCAPENLVPNELYASRHCDTNPVDCIEDKAYVLTASAFARFMAQVKHRQSAYPRTPLNRVVPIRPPKSTLADLDGIGTGEPFSEESDDNVSWTGRVPDNANPSNVFLCRGVYDYRLKRVCRNVNFPMLPIHSHFLINRHRNSRPSSVHPPLDDDTGDTIDRPVTTHTTIAETLTVCDASDTVALDPGTPSKSSNCLSSESVSPEPSPADSPSLCICLPDSPEPVVTAPSKPSTTVPETSSVVYSPPGSTLPSIVDSSTAVDRSSTPLKSRDSVSTTKSTTWSGAISSTSAVAGSHMVRIPTGAPSQTRTSGGGWEKSTSNTTSVLTTPLPAAPHLIPASSNTPQVWIPAHPIMPLFESSMLETSADLSVNWAEHGEQIALSLDCRACKPSVPSLVLPSYPILSTGRTVSVAHNLLDPQRTTLPTEASTMAWSSAHENPIATELFEPPHPMSILCPDGATGVTASGVSNPHESDAPRLVML